MVPENEKVSKITAAFTSLKCSYLFKSNQNHEDQNKILVNLHFDTTYAVDILPNTLPSRNY